MLQCSRQQKQKVVKVDLSKLATGKWTVDLGAGLTKDANKSKNHLL